MIDALAFSEELERYLAHLQSDGGASVQAVAMARRDVSEFLSWAEEAGVKHVLHPTMHKVCRYANYLRQQHKLSHEAIEDKVKALAGFYEWLFLFGQSPDKTRNLMLFLSNGN